MQVQFLTEIRRKNPLIHNITNIVAANFSANGLLALGASPLMSAALEEMEEVPALSDALVINIGTLIGKDPEAMLLAGKSANRAGIPVVLDPVGVGATCYRRNTVAHLLNDVRFALIRGNAGELATIAELADIGKVNWQVKGVDAGQGSGDLAEIARIVARKYGCVVAISGETDYISNGRQSASVYNGTPMFPQITASGCLLSAVCAAFLAVAGPKRYFAAVVEACTAYAVAGELAAENLQSHQLGRFSVGLLDQLAAITPQQVERLAKISL